MRFLVTILLCLCNLFLLLEPSLARQNLIDFSSSAEKKTWLASILSSVRRAASFKGKWSLTTSSRAPKIEVLDPEVRSQLQADDEKIKTSKLRSSAFRALLSGKSVHYHSLPSDAAGKQAIGPSSVEKLESLFSARLVPKPSPPSSLVIQEINSTAASDVVRQSAGESASPTPIPSVLFQEVVICKARNPIWNVGIRNKMGELLVLAYPGSLAKAETFARCIRDDVTTMKREEYLQFAVYNCVGTDRCFTNSATGVCSCTTGTPERCINVDYTRALIECKYGPGVGA